MKQENVGKRNKTTARDGAPPMFKRKVGAGGVALAILAMLVCGVSETKAVDEPLELVLHASSELGGWRFLQGAPLGLTVSVVNVGAREEEAAAIADWRSRAREAERVDGPMPPHPGALDVGTSLAIDLGSDNLAWLSDVTMTVERIEPSPATVLAKMNWDDLQTSPSERTEGNVVLKLDPVWATLKMPQDMTAALSPGRYRFTANKLGAKSGSLELVIQPPTNEHELGIVHHEQAIHALQNGNLEEAISKSTLALAELSHEPAVAQLTLGQAFAANGQLNEALNAMEAFLEAFEESHRWEEFPLSIRNYTEDLRLQIEEGR